MLRTRGRVHRPFAVRDAGRDAPGMRARTEEGGDQAVGPRSASSGHLHGVGRREVDGVGDL